MEKTNIEHFNSFLKQFVLSVIETFDEYKDVITEYYKELLESETCNDDKYVKRFLNKTKDYKKFISEEDEALFLEDIYILKNVNFKILWESGEMSENNKKKIWKYLQTLYVLSETIINDTKTISELVNQFKNINNEKSTEGEEPKLDTDVFKMLKNLSTSNDENVDTIFNDSGMIGKLASELTEELDINNLDLGLDMEGGNMEDLFSNLINGDNSLKFMNLIQTVGHKIQNKIQSGELDATSLLSEAQSVMANLNNNPEMAGMAGMAGMPDMAQFANMANMANMAEAPLNPTQERLRKKLEKRKQNKNQ